MVCLPALTQRQAWKMKNPLARSNLQVDYLCLQLSRGQVGSLALAGRLICLSSSHNVGGHGLACQCVMLQLYKSILLYARTTYVTA